MYHTQEYAWGAGGPPYRATIRDLTPLPSSTTTPPPHPHGCRCQPNIFAGSATGSGDASGGLDNNGNSDHRMRSHASCQWNRGASNCAWTLTLRCPTRASYTAT